MLKTIDAHFNKIKKMETVMHLSKQKKKLSMRKGGFNNIRKSKKKIIIR